jgi:hypothetical protein
MNGLLTSQATPFWLMDDFLPYIKTLLNPFIRIKLGSGHAFVVLEAHVRVLIPNNGCHLYASYTQALLMFV